MTRHNRETEWTKCARCDHYGGEHDANGCQCVVVMSGGECECACEAFVLPKPAPGTDIHTQAEAMRDALVTARARLEQIGRYDFASPQTIRVIDAALGTTSSPPTIDRAEADRRYAFSKKFPCSDGAELIKHGCGCRYVYQGVNVTTQQCATHAGDNLDTHAGEKK